MSDQEQSHEQVASEEVTSEEVQGLEAQAEASADEPAALAEPPSMTAEEVLGSQPGGETSETATADAGRIELKALLEALVYVTDEPLTAQQIAAAVERPIDVVKELLDELVTEYAQPGRGLTVREVAGGYKMATKPEHHESVRTFVKNLRPPLKLSLPALETLAVIGYKQPITAPEIMEIRGVQGAGVLKTLIDRKLITPAGRKNVVGKPILYKTTKDFLLQFGLKDLNELPTLKEFEELSRLSIADAESDMLPLEDPPTAAEAAQAEAQANAETEAESESDSQPEAAPDKAEEAVGNG